VEEAKNDSRIRSPTPHAQHGFKPYGAFTFRSLSRDQGKPPISREGRESPTRYRSRTLPVYRRPSRFTGCIMQKKSNPSFDGSPQPFKRIPLYGSNESLSEQEWIRIDHATCTPVSAREPKEVTRLRNRAEVARKTYEHLSQEGLPAIFSALDCEILRRAGLE
jgi:hypothetical protein